MQRDWNFRAGFFSDRRQEIFGAGPDFATLLPQPTASIAVLVRAVHSVAAGASGRFSSVARGLPCGVSSMASFMLG